MTDVEQGVLRRIVNGLAGSMLQDDTAGRTEYERRIVAWSRVHGNSRVLLERTGFPLSPGTAPPCSGECYGCGKITTPWHHRSECQGPTLPAKESTFRALCAKYLREQVAVNTVLDDLEWMDFAPRTDEEQDFGAGLSE
jgi:hypothetical protein